MEIKRISGEVIYAGNATHLETQKDALVNLLQSSIDFRQVTQSDPHTLPHQYLDFRRADLVGIDLRNQNLRGMDFSMANMNNADLRGADVRGVNFAGANLINVRLDHAQMQQANFMYTNMTGANLSGSYVDPADLRMATLKDVVSTGLEKPDTRFLLDATGHILFESSIMEDAPFIRAALLVKTSMQYADLRGMDFSNANFCGGNFRYAILSTTNLENARFEGCMMDHANMSYARLNQADFEYSDLRHADMTDSQLAYTKFQRADLSNADLRGTTCFETDFSKANLQYADFSHAKINLSHWRNANLNDAKLALPDNAVHQDSGTPFTLLNQSKNTLYGTYAMSLKEAVESAVQQRVPLPGLELNKVNLSEANLRGGYFCGAVMVNTNFQSADACDANFSGAILTRSDFEGALLNRSNFTQADLIEARFCDAKAAHAQFDQSILHGTSFRGADLDGANMENVQTNRSTVFPDGFSDRTDQAATATAHLSR